MPNPTLEEDGVVIEIVKGTGIGSFKKEIGDLVTGSTYYVRAYLRNEYHTIYGDIVSFVAEEPPYVIIPEYNLMVMKNDLGEGTHYYSDAANLCTGSIVAGYTDWRLPTIEELTVMYNLKETIGGFVTNSSYSNGTYYWSSTACYSSTYVFDFQWGMTRCTNQTSCVRAVRTITQ